MSLFLSIFLSSLQSTIQFIVKYWKVFATLLLLGVVVMGSYNYGYKAADRKWTSAYNERVSELNLKIVDLESKSKEDAKVLVAENDNLQKKLKELTESFPKVTPKTSKGTPLLCNGKPIVETIYLGTDFTDDWNKLNDEGAKVDVPVSIDVSGQTYSMDGEISINLTGEGIA